ncbi:M20 family metallopeptidase [Arthrobacter rhombi]|uniref:M20 metallopeptidase family protein n=1 Tax=Arthrobacter rhombi TaxID=71253 RepID=UPI0031DAF5D0
MNDAPTINAGANSPGPATPAPAADAALDTPALSGLATGATALAPELVELRREIHRQPELGLDLPLTQASILRRLQDLDGLEITTGSRQSSVTAVLRGRAPYDGERPVILLRGDMDALPVLEETGLDFSSAVTGHMHACGHDLHVAGLYGAARLLHDRRDDLVADVVFMFQPGEEAYHGARYMVEDGVLQAAGRRVDSAYGLHVFSATYESGVFYSRPGPLMAGCEEFFVTVHGAGGHGSLPHLGKDPVPVAAEIIVALQTLVTRGYNVFDPVVATVGRLEAGTAGNIIPDAATFDISLRLFSPENKKKLLVDVARLVEGIASAHGLTASYTLAPDYPVTINDDVEHRFAQDTVQALLGDESFRELEFPMPGSEDFSHVLNEVPGAFLVLGARIGNSQETNHSPRADFDESVLPKAAAVLAGLALARPGWSC